MVTVSLTRVLIDGTILSLLLSALIFGSLAWNPRLWMQDFPAPVRDRMAPLTAPEKRIQRLLMLPFVGLFIVLPLLSTHWLSVENGAALPFATLYLHIFLVLMVFNVFDAVVIDWLVLAQFRPKFALVPEAAGLEYTLHDSRLHIVNFLKGVVFCAAFSAPLALAALVL